MKQNIVKGYTLEKLRKLPFDECKKTLKDFTVEELDLLYENIVPPKRLSKFDKNLIHIRFFNSPEFLLNKESFDFLLLLNNKLEETFKELIQKINRCLKINYENSIYGIITGKVNLKFPANTDKAHRYTGMYAFINKYIKENFEPYILLTPNNEDYNLYCGYEEYNKTIKYLSSEDMPYLKRYGLEECYYFMPERFPYPLPEYLKNTTICSSFEDFVKLECFNFLDLLKIKQIDFYIEIENYSSIKVREGKFNENSN